MFNSAINDDVVDDEYESDFVQECSNESSMTFSSSETIDDDNDDDDATSSSLSFHDGPLYELSELMEQLPIKRGLSKYYDGKSESFGSLANFNNIDDLAKKRSSQRSRKSKCKSQSCLSPKTKILKLKKTSYSSNSVSRTCLVSSLGVRSLLCKNLFN
ncbi:hypothetical protein QVD17_26495 [Tagetes erecta]|uniref:Oxidative stress 3 n=1 Tax=Tagetes erecta TaxID=13708 RepID=A0AAD8K959_TARER|nr:hypothetical protein QVD17_26495 [Tagetes erecta]